MDNEERLIRFDYVSESEQPYKASYINWQTAPIHPRLGLGGKTGYMSGSYGFMMRAILGDLIVLPEEDIPGLALTGPFRQAVGQNVENLTITILSKDILKKLKGKEMGLDELIKKL